MASFLFDEGAESLQDNSIVWATDTINARLVASSVTPSQTATSMTGLTAIGTDQTLTSKTRTKDTAEHRIVYEADDPVWPAVPGGSTFGWCVIYKFVTNDAGSTPIALIDLADIATNGSDVTVQFDADGAFYLQQ